VGLLWTEALAVGIPAIDEQHQELFRRVESLLAAAADGNSAEVTRMLGFLTEYAELHFAAEEAFMREQSYPGIEAHQAEHVHLMNQVALLSEEYRRTGPDPALRSRMHHLLADWLRTHIGLTDSAMARFVRRARRI
jgi:hemerythrin